MLHTYLTVFIYRYYSESPTILNITFLFFSICFRSAPLTTSRTTATTTAISPTTVETTSTTAMTTSSSHVLESSLRTTPLTPNPSTDMNHSTAQASLCKSRLNIKTETILRRKLYLLITILNEIVIMVRFCLMYYYAALPLTVHQSPIANFTLFWLIISRSHSPNLANTVFLPAFGKGDQLLSRRLWRITTMIIAFVNKQKSI